MGTGYTRNDTANNIADGNVINAADFDGEYDAIEAAFNSSTGHTHDGTAAEGGPITVLGPSQEFVASASAVAPSTNAGLDLGTTSLKFNDLYIDGTAYIDGLGGNLLIDTSNALQFRDTALSISSSADGQLDIAADTTAKITSPEVIVTDDFRLQSDAAILTFGADDDVSVTHVADTGLDAQAASGFTLKLQTGDTTVESGNTIGKISFNAPDEASGTDAILVGAEIEAAAEDTFSSTVNSTALVFKTNTSAAATERMRIKSDGDIVFTGASANMTWDTSADSLDFADGGQVALGSDDDLVITHSGTAGSITNATGDLTVDVAGDIILDADGADIVFKDDGTQIGKITNASNNLEIHSSVSDADIVFKGNDGGVTVTALTLDMSEGGKAIFASGVPTAFGGATTITTNDNTTQLTLESTDTDANSGPQLDLYRNSATPADNDYIGRIKFIGKNDAAEDFTGIDFLGRTIDVSDGTEDASLFINVMTGGTTWNRLNITPTEIVINEESQDLDFRVETNGEDYALFVDGGNDAVHIGGNTDVDDHPLVVHANTNANAIAIRGRSDDIGEITFYENDATTKLGGLQYRNTYTRLDNRASGASLDFATGAALTESASFSATENVFNDGGVDMDFRVESDNNANMFKIDAGNDRAFFGSGGFTTGLVGMDYNLDTSADWYSDSKAVLMLKNSNTNGNVSLKMNNQGTNSSFIVHNTSGTEGFHIYDRTITGKRFSADSTETVINEDSKNLDFRVEGDTISHCLYLDASQDQVQVQGQFRALGNVSAPSSNGAFLGKYATGSGDADVGELVLASDGAATWSAGNSHGRIKFYTTDSSGIGARSVSIIECVSENGGTTLSGALRFLTSPYNTVASERMRINAAGELLLGSTSHAGTGLFEIQQQSNAATAGMGILGTSSATSMRLYTVDNVSTIGRGSVKSMSMASDGSVRFNDGQASAVDFQVKTGTNTNMLYVDAGDNFVGIGTNQSTFTGRSGVPLTVSGGSTATTNPVTLIRDGDGSVEGGSTILGLTFSEDNSFTSANFIHFTDSGGEQGRIHSTGGGSVTYATTSDRRVKENIRDTASKIDDLKAIQVRDYELISDGSSHTGFIAQELHTVIPDAVTVGGDDVREERWGVEYGKVTPVLVKALQEALAKIEDLEARVTALESS